MVFKSINALKSAVFRIRIGIGFKWVSGSGFRLGIRIQIQAGQNCPQKMKNFKNVIFVEPERPSQGFEEKNKIVILP
jgi:hypothetical protein